MIRRAAARLLAVGACCAGMAMITPAGDVVGTALASSRTGSPPAPAVPAVGATLRSPPELPVTGAALYAPATGQILYGVHANRRMAIASATKLMTALVTVEHVRRLATEVTQNDYYPAPGDSVIGLVPGERMSVHDLLLGLMLPSGDDAAEDLAFNVGRGSVARFVAMMNAEARRLGLRDTHYTTPSGLDTPGNYSSPADLVRLAAYDLAHSRLLAHIVDLPRAVIRINGRAVPITNRNDLVGRYRWIDGVKTGHTNSAGYVLVAAGHRDGMSLISVVLGTASVQARDASTLALLGYGFKEFGVRTPVRQGTVLARPVDGDRPGVHVPLIAGGTVTRVLPRAARVTLRTRVPRQVTGPLPAGTVIGSATVLAGGRVVGTVPLVLARRLTAVSGLTLAARFVTRPLTLIVIALLAAAGAMVVRTGRRRRRIGREGGELEAA